ncbi:MAG: GNAT family N-acetyltransferase [Oscillospiraceae bacterium]|nr:GNAT family N-acetyltransferase [Oscillospiraceae bacterium]
MIRYSQPADMPAMRGIWDACFPEDRAFAGFFFKNLYGRALVFETGGQVTSMLHLLPFKRGDGADVTYIYGVGTLPEYRRRGQSAALINAALSGGGCCILIPAEPWLFGFYEKFGFKTVFYKYEFKTPPLDRARRANPSDIPMLNAVYRAAVSPRVERTDTHWSHYLDDILVFDGGYAILSNKCVIEAFGTDVSSAMTEIPFGMATAWPAEKAYLNAMYN